MKWTQMPDESGWWFFASRLEDWDLAMPVGVSRHEDMDGTVTFVARGKDEPIARDAGWWFGPFRVEKPERVVEREIQECLRSIRDRSRNPHPPVTRV